MKLRQVLDWIVPQEGNGLLFWRGRILSAMLLGLSFFSLAALLPSVYYASRDGAMSVVIIDVSAYLLVLGITVARRASTRARSFCVVVLIYVLGAFFLLRYGVASAGSVWLFSFGVMSAVLLGFRAAYFALALNFVTYIVLCVLSATDVALWPGTLGVPFERLVVVSVSSLLLNTLAATSVAALLRGLDGEVAARRRAEHEHVLLAGAVEQAAEAIAITDLSGRVRYANAAFARFAEASEDSLKGRVLTDMMQPAIPRTKGAAQRDPWASIAGGNVWSGHLDVGRANPRVAEAAITPFRDEDGELTHGLAVLRDVTRERELEAQLRQSQKLEAIGTLAGGIAHDFNNLLMPILLNVEELQRAAPGETIDHRLLRDVHTAAERARDLVSRILAFSRNETPDRRPVDPASVVRELVPLLRATMPATIRVVTHVVDGSSVLADPGELHQTLMNLATNALHAMPAGGSLTISVKRASGDARELALEVSDTGTGMSPETIRRAFEPFFTTKTQGRGTGLGLATVHGIVTSLGGRIETSSTIGEGTTVRVILPTVADAGALVPVLSRPEAPLPGFRVLLIDDEPAILSATQRLLARLGVQVECESDPRTALELLRLAPEAFDCVLTDLTMPHMSGVQLAQAMHASRIATPVVLMTGYLDLAGFDALASAGIGQVVAKPFTLSQVSQALRTAIECRSRVEIAV